MGNRYGLKEAPDHVPATGNGVGFRDAAAKPVVPSDTLPIWSSFAPLPAIDTEVVVRMNGAGRGRVTGYFIENGFLGLELTMARVPHWYNERQRKEYGRSLHVFGLDLEV